MPNNCLSMTDTDVLERYDKIIEVIEDLVRVMLTIAMDGASTDLRNQLKKSGCLHKSHDKVADMFIKYCGNGIIL